MPISLKMSSGWLKHFLSKEKWCFMKLVINLVLAMLSQHSFKWKFLLRMGPLISLCTKIIQVSKGKRNSLKLLNTLDSSVWNLLMQQSSTKWAMYRTYAKQYSMNTLLWLNCEQTIKSNINSIFNKLLLFYFNLSFYFTLKKLI